MKPLFSRSIRSALVLLALLAASAAVLAAQQPFYLHDQDTVLFYGDSITEQRLYTTFVETFVVTRYPQLNVRFVNSAWGGENAPGGNGGPAGLRLTRDVLPYKPTVMTVMLGMNDGGYIAFDEARFKRYTAGMEHILQVVKSAFPNLRVTLLEPSPYDDVTQEPQFPGGYNGVLVRYGQYVRELARRNQMLVADLNAPVVEMLKKANALDPAGAKALIPGRIHPSPGAHLVMAEALLKAWGASPIVSVVEIDASSKQVAKAENTSVTGLTVGSTISWSQKDAALPMLVSLRDRSLPIGPRRGAATMDLALKSSDFMEALNQETLRVRGLEGAEVHAEDRRKRGRLFQPRPACRWPQPGRAADPHGEAGARRPPAHAEAGRHSRNAVEAAPGGFAKRQLGPAARRPGRSRCHGRRVGRTPAGGRTARRLLIRANSRMRSRAS